MRAAVCRTLGGLEGLAVVDDWPEPQLRPGQVIVTMHAAALNFPDLLTMQGTYQHKQTPPYVPGMEGAGIVTAVGADVSSDHIGRAVAVSARGTLAERVAVDPPALGAVPEGWSLAEAAAFPVVARTAYHALVQRAALAAGETLLVHGAAGGTGHMAVKLGKALGARVIATGRHADKLAVVCRLGADATVLIGDGAADLAERFKAAAGPRGVDVVFDPVGGDVFEASLKAAAFGARIAIVGFTAGAPNAVRTNYALIKGLTLLGIRAGEAARHDPRLQRAYDTALPDLAETHDLRPHIGARFDLAESRAAFACLAGRGAVGKVVVTM